jgi:dephospho-CoA kinase
VSSSDDSARTLLRDPAVRRAVADAANLLEDFAPSDLRERMLASNETRRSVNRILHPKIVALAPPHAATTGAVGFFEVPLLIETCQWTAYDQIWAVSCGVEEQIRRLVARYGDPRLAERLLSVQASSAARLQFADVIIRTNQSMESVRSDLDRALFALVSRFDCRQS